MFNDRNRMVLQSDAKNATPSSQSQVPAVPLRRLSNTPSDSSERVALMQRLSQLGVITNQSLSTEVLRHLVQTIEEKNPISAQPARQSSTNINAAAASANSSGRYSIELVRNIQPQKQSMPEALPSYSDPNKAPGSDTPYYLLSPSDLEEAAEKDPNAKFIFALALLNGYQGCPLQFERGKQLMLDLVKEAPRTAGGLCAQGKINEHGWISNIKDIRSALEKYNEAKEMGYVPAQYLYISRNNAHFDVDGLTAIASQYNYGPAKSELAHLYYYGNEEKRVEKNITKASTLAYSAADINHDLYSRIIAGYCLYNYGEKSDYPKAREYMKAAKEQVISGGNWPFAEKRLQSSIENSEFDEMPLCFRAILLSWYGCCCVSSFFYPRIVPNRATIACTFSESSGEPIDPLWMRILCMPCTSVAFLFCFLCTPCAKEGDKGSPGVWRTAPCSPSI